LTGVDETEVIVSIETGARGHAAERASADRAALRGLDWTPSLQAQVGGWTWRVDPDDRLPPADAGGRPIEIDRQLVRALAMAPLLLG
jgi:hypothetical protein